MIKQVSYKEAFRIFGDPGIPDDQKKIERNLVKVVSPYVLMPAGIKEIVCHVYIAEDLQAALNEIYHIFGDRLTQVQGLNWYSGCYVHRKTTDGEWWAAHAWGLAVDMCYPMGEYKVPPIIPYHYVNAFLKRGFNWGGNYKTFYDGMHFSAINEG